MLTNKQNLDCDLCGLRTQGHIACLWGRGPVPAKIMVIGSSPSIIDSQMQQSFSDLSGKQLSDCLYIAGISFADVYVTTAIKCYSANTRTFSKIALEKCKSYLQEEINTVNPEIIVTLGKESLMALTGLETAMKVAGSVINYKYKETENSPEIVRKIFATYSLGYVKRNPSYLPRIKKHFEDLGRLVRGETLVKSKCKYVTIENMSQFKNFANTLKQQRLVAFDLETTGLDFVTNAILCFSFSWRKNTGIVLPILGYQCEELWSREDVAFIYQTLIDIFADSAISWVGHNISFDMKFVKNVGIVIAGEIHDTMLLSTLLDENAQDLKGLKALANVYTDMGKYDDELDEIIQNLKIHKRREINDEKKQLMDLMKERKKLHKQLLKKSDTDPVVIIDLETEINKIGAAINTLPGTTSIDISYSEIPTNILWLYAAKDADATIRIFYRFIQDLSEINSAITMPLGKNIYKLYKKLIMPLRKVLTEMEYTGAALDLAYLKELDIKYSLKREQLHVDLIAMPEIAHVEKVLYKLAWDKIGERYNHLKNKTLNITAYCKKHTKVVPFNLNSSNHLRILLFDILKLKPIKFGTPHKKTGEINASTDKETLEYYENAHACVTLLMENRKVAKLHTTYVQGMQSRVDSTGRIHTNFNQHVARTGRLSSSNPNLQNIPRKDKDIKKAFITKPDWSIVQADYCVPIHAEILTRNGFVKKENLTIDEEVLGYNLKTGKCEWTRLESIYEVKNAPTYKIYNKGFNFVATGNHKWVTKVNNKPRKETTSEIHNQNPERQLVVSAPAEGGNYPVTAREAAILGWIITDGHIQLTGPRRTSLNVFIYQSPKKYANEIRQLLAKDLQSERTVTGEWGVPCINFRLSSYAARRLFKKVNLNFEVTNLLKIIPYLSKKARAAMLDAMLKAEGSKTHNGKGITTQCWCQKPGPVLDIFILLATLEGKRLSGFNRMRESGVISLTVSKRQCLRTRLLKIEKNSKNQDVWCPQTSLGTWVCKLDDQITITSNSQAEFRMWGQLSGDEKMLSDIKSGLDIHSQTASEFWGIPYADIKNKVKPEYKELRNAAKFVVFGLMYGRGSESVAKQVGIEKHEAEQIIEHFFAKYPIAAHWLKATKTFAQQHQFVINHFGRLRRLPDAISRDRMEVSSAMRQAVNAPIQGSAADITGVALVRIWKELLARKLQAKLILTVHDSIILECPNTELLEIVNLVHTKMTDPIQGIIVPMEAEIEVGKTWATVEEWPIAQFTNKYTEYLSTFKN